MAPYVRGLVFISCVVFCLCFVPGTSAADIVQHELLARIEALEIQGREQANTLLTQSTRLEQLESKLEIQNVKLVSQEQTIKNYKQKVAELERKVDEISTDASTDIEKKVEKSDIDDVGQTKHENRSQVKSDINKGNIQRRLVVTSDDMYIAFHAVIKAAQDVNHIGISQKIVFPDVMINLGGGYRNQHGIFTAPRAGIYLFSTSIMADYRNHVEISVHIRKNGNVLANANAHGDSGRHDQGSVTVVTQMDVGDEVWVSLYSPADTSLWGDSFDSFMGCLIAPLS